MPYATRFRNPQASSLLAGLAMFAAWSCAAVTCESGEWPQILGPDRNGVAVDETLADAWPEGGPPLVWKYAVGEGLAGVAVAQGKAIVFHRVKDREVVEALDSKTGKPLWKNDFPTGYVSRISEDNGPRCVPLVAGDRVFLVGAETRLHCVKLADGKALWSRSLKKDFRIGDSYFGAGSSPIVVGEKLLLNVGGRGGAGIVAFAVADGKTLWQATDEDASYSSPVAATIDGTRHVIFAARLNAVSVDPESGRTHFRFPFGERGPTVNAGNPVVFDRHVFLSASYGIGAKLAEIEKLDAKVLWAGDDAISSQYTTSIYRDGFLYGIDGRQDIGVARLRCFDVKTREIRWTEADFGYATLILVGDKLLAMKTNGQLIVAHASPAKHTELAEAQIATGTTRALPALSDGLLYIRNEHTLYCVRVGEK